MTADELAELAERYYTELATAFVRGRLGGLRALGLRPFSLGKAPGKAKKAPARPAAPAPAPAAPAAAGSLLEYLTRPPLLAGEDEEQLL